MRILLFTIGYLLFSATAAFCQQWHNTVAVESRVGYSTNSYLTPYFAEWNRTTASGYSFNSVMGQTFWNTGQHSTSLALGVTYQPFFQQSMNNWSGLVGLGKYGYRMSNNWRVGIEGGGSSFAGAYNRRLAWIQPKITWYMGPFTLVHVKAGSFYQHYKYPNQEDLDSRVNFYDVKVEMWPAYRWQLSTGLSGSLKHLPDIREGVSARAQLSYLLNNGSTVSLSGGIRQYQTDSTTGVDGVLNGYQYISDTDRIFRIGLDMTIPVNKRVGAFVTADYLHFISQSADTKTSDYQLSGGIRLSFEPRLGKSNTTFEPEWTVESHHQTIKVNYSGEGRLYLVGDFNDWSKDSLPLIRQSEDTHVTELTLPPGSYEYKILKVQGNTEEWLQFSADTYTVDDGFGSENAMLLVE